MGRALIIGCGGIGRGFMPWLLEQFEIDFLDSDKNLLDGIFRQGGFSSFMSDGEILKKKWVSPRRLLNSLEGVRPDDYDIVFISVGPRNIHFLPPEIGKLNCPIYSLENDPATVDSIKQLYKLKTVYFGIPDVITSSTASPENLAIDPYAIHTENGVLYLQESLELDKRLYELLPEINWLPVERLNQEWDAKLYIHNTPHCIAAYLGYLAGCTYLHEALAVPIIKKILDGVIEELLYALKLITPYDHNFIESYAIKEVRRFSNTLLFDPITRVAREPIRKLHPSGRLIGALRILLSTGVRPTYLLVGIVAALEYSDVNDRDRLQLQYLGSFGVKSFIKYHLGLQPNSLESQYISKYYNDTLVFLRRELVCD